MLALLLLLKLRLPAQNVADVLPNHLHVPHLCGEWLVFRLELVPFFDQCGLLLLEFFERWEVVAHKQLVQRLERFLIGFNLAAILGAEGIFWTI